MDIKKKRYSYSITSKIIAFLITVFCFSVAITLFLNMLVLGNEDLSIVNEKSYYQSDDYIHDSSQVIQTLDVITQVYKSEDHILSGGTITDDEIAQYEEELYREFEFSSSYDQELSPAGNRGRFREAYADEIALAREKLINEDLDKFRAEMKSLKKYQGVIYYAKKGETEFTNSPNDNKSHFKSAPAYMIFEGLEEEVFPKEMNVYLPKMALKSDEVMYIAFTDEFIKPRLEAWNETKTKVNNMLYWLEGSSLALAAAFIWLLFIIGRKPEDDKIHLNDSIDKIYTDINLGLCALLIASWFGSMAFLFRSEYTDITFLVTLTIAAAGLILVLSLVKHVKNRTLFTYTLTYKVFYQVFAFIKDVFNSGSTAVKVVLIVVVYPIIAGLGFIMLPITIAVAAWLALKKVEEFNAIKVGVKQVKEGNFRHTIVVPGEGELALLAADINSITDGLNKAVESEIKSERLKSELITNVSHDIRTPLTSIITYVDLLKSEQDPEKIAEYVEVLDQKAQRLKTLTDDLFEATKASSGNIPVNFEKIDLVSLITQGLGEFDDKIQENNLEFKLNHSSEKIHVRADGKLLWRTIENLLLNIFKYALKDSRVYIDISDAGSDAVLTIKNISAYELNISASELMERFTRGDAARSSQGSGLGLSIAKSLIEIQKGSFMIEIDGDLFKAVIHMPKES